MMTLFRMPRWIRRIIRRNTSPVPEIQAFLIRRNLSLGYAFVAWNVCGYIGYLIYTGRLKKLEDDSGLSQGRQFAKLFKTDNVTLVRVEGLTPVGIVNLQDEAKRETRDDSVEQELKTEEDS